MTVEDDIALRIEGRVGCMTLNRPKALNALTYDMVMAIDGALREWNRDPAIDMVLIEGAGEKAFCAGGDIQDLYRSGRDGDFDYGRRFWSDEYRMNARLANFPKPYVALMDGIVMGGGVGVSAHGSHRIVTERTQVAMPECGIGLVPDVGASWRLAHAPGHVGDYVGLTGARLGAADAIYAGLADGYVHSSDLPALRQALVEAADLAVLTDFWDDPEEGSLAGMRQDIDAAFGFASLAETVERLEGEGGDWNTRTAAALRRASPISLACAFEIIRAARQAGGIEDALTMEYRFSSRCIEHGNFLEGVRAAIVDKDRNPRWAPARLEDVSPEAVAFMLAPAEGGDLDFRT